jgi:nitrate/TMAO reductase-like tetraheme cytochrome c subunit
MKTCTECHNTKPLDAFYQRKRSPSGREENRRKANRIDHLDSWSGQQKGA